MPLTAILTSVVGMLVSLAPFCATHVFWIAIATMLAVSATLFRFKVGTIKLIFGCALAGLVLSYS